MWLPACHEGSLLSLFPSSVKMKLLLVAAAVLAVASCATISLEDLEFHAWKLKFGEKQILSFIICSQVHFPLFSF